MALVLGILLLLELLSFETSLCPLKSQPFSFDIFVYTSYQFNLLCFLVHQASGKCTVLFVQQFLPGLLPFHHFIFLCLDLGGLICSAGLGYQRHVDVWQLYSLYVGNLHFPATLFFLTIIIKTC